MQRLSSRSGRQERPEPGVCAVRRGAGPPGGKPDRKDESQDRLDLVGLRRDRAGVQHLRSSLVKRSARRS